MWMRWDEPTAVAGAASLQSPGSIGRVEAAAGLGIGGERSCSRVVLVIHLNHLTSCGGAAYVSERCQQPLKVELHDHQQEVCKWASVAREELINDLKDNSQQDHHR